MFLLIFLFNVGGYYIVFWGLRSQAKSDLLHRLDAEQYSSEDLVVLTIPISVPYPIQQNGYERVNGEFEYHGEYYNLVKQRLENDTLFMVCIKDHHEKKLVSALNEYSNLANSLPTDARHTMDLFGKLFKDYTTSAFSSMNSAQGWCAHIQAPTSVFDVLQQDYPIHTPPPKV